MLQRIRDKVQGWVAGLIIVILVISFLFWGIQYYIEQSAGGNDPVVAKINGQKIYSKDLNQAYQIFLQRQQISQTLSGPMQQQIKQYVLQGLITNALLIQSAEKAGFHADLNQIEKMVASDPTFQVNGRFSPEKLQQVLYTYGLNPSDFFNKVLTAYITQQVTSGIQNSAFATPNQVKEAYLLLKQLRDFKYAVIPASQFISSIKISDAEIQDYYNQQQNQFIQPEKVQVNYIILSPAILKKQVQVTAEEMQDYYQNHKDNFTVHGKSKEPTVKSFAEVSASLRQMLIAQKVEKLFSEKSDQLANLVYTNPTTLDVAAKQLNLPIQTSPLIARNDASVKGVFAEPKVLAAIFKGDVLQSGNNSTPIELKDGGVIVVRVLKHVASQPLSLNLVRDKIQKTLAAQAAGRQAGVTAYKIQSDLLAGNADKKILNQYANLHWIDKEKVARGDRSIPNEILTAVFNLKLPKTNATTTTAQLSNGDYAIIVLRKAETLEFSKASKRELNMLQAQLSGLEGQLDYKFYIKSALDNVKLKIYPKNM